MVKRLLAKCTDFLERFTFERVMPVDRKERIMKRSTQFLIVFFVLVVAIALVAGLGRRWRAGLGVGSKVL
jgi:hypothetical protein